ncbi:hypothetical protein D9757_009746 [Collybiopsis confluens]|uniref:NmrA-like domain-containing protein n=1 Tax=Collybiopsis confluens TaxID=2823264 RepID=A0A8H5GY15_9AGAR|nr:hypothetical protein D9757_009746 [Collybiopsis confluens]
MSKKILVIGATGSQGIPVVMSLLAPDEEGNPSPYSVRVFTRSPTSENATVLGSLPGIEVVKGDFGNLETLILAMESCYGIFVNTDTLIYGEMGELYAGIKMFEAAHRVEGLKHFLYSGLDYGYKLGGYQRQYSNAPHLNARGVVAEFIKSQPSDSEPAGRGLAWTVMTSGPYLENLGGYMLGARPNQNGTANDPNEPLIFDIPTKNGHIPMMCLDDLGWWSRYIFDHLPRPLGKN